MQTKVLIQHHFHPRRMLARTRALMDFQRTTSGAASRFAVTSAPPVLLSEPLLDEAVALLMRRPDAAEVGLSASDARTIATYMHFEQIAAGSVVRFRSDKNRRMLFLLDGELTVYLVDRNERMALPLSHLGAGAFYGQLSTLTKSVAPSVAHVERDMSCGSLTLKGLDRIMERYPVIGAKLMRLLLIEVAMVASDSIRQINALNRVNESLRAQLNMDRSQEKLLQQFSLD
jgi:CRP-like cAMP-binding protein